MLVPPSHNLGSAVSHWLDAEKDLAAARAAQPCGEVAGAPLAHSVFYECNDEAYRIVGSILRQRGYRRVRAGGRHIAFCSSDPEAKAQLHRLGTELFTGFVQDEGAKLQSLHKSQVPYAKTSSTGLPCRIYVPDLAAQVSDSRVLQSRRPCPLSWCCLAALPPSSIPIPPCPYPSAPTPTELSERQLPLSQTRKA